MAQYPVTFGSAQVRHRSTGALNNRNDRRDEGLFGAHRTKALNPLLDASSPSRARLGPLDREPSSPAGSPLRALSFVRPSGVSVGRSKSASSLHDQAPRGGRLTRTAPLRQGPGSRLDDIQNELPSLLPGQRPGSNLTASDIRQSVGLNPHAKDQSKGLRLIFLDVDGVLHSVRALRPEQQFQKSRMQLLQHLVMHGNCQIVMSSAWRLSPQTFRIVNAKLRQYGMEPVIDKTADHGPVGRRSDEILRWVDSHGPISAWVAIDDMNLAAGEPRMAGHFIHTNALVGLTPELIERALSYLDGQTRGNVDHPGVDISF